MFLKGRTYKKERGTSLALCSLAF